MRAPEAPRRQHRAAGVRITTLMHQHARMLAVYGVDSVGTDVWGDQVGQLGIFGIPY